MAVKRKVGFTISLGNLVQERLDSFSDTRETLRAVEEADFQRTVIDNDLDHQERLDYRKSQLELEKGKTYKDQSFISDLKSSISVLKNQVKNQKFRDDYFTLLSGMASGNKTLDDQISFLKTSLGHEYLDAETKSKLETAYTSAVSNKVSNEMAIVDANIEFNEKDRTAKSLDKAISSVKSQLAKSIISKNPALKTSYELQLKSLEKDKLEVGIEDSAISMSVNMMSQTRPNDSMWKVDSFVNLRDKASANIPVTIDGVRYESAKDYWDTSLNSYIRTDFAKDYAAENDKNMTNVYNKMGILPDTSLNNLSTLNNSLRNNPEFADFQSVVDSATQNSISKALEYKAKEIERKHHLNAAELTTQANINAAQLDLKKLETQFGDYYSLSPYMSNLDTMLNIKKTQLTTDIMTEITRRSQEEGISLEEALTKYGSEAARETEVSDMESKTPEEIVEGYITEGKEKIEGTTTQDEDIVKEEVVEPETIKEDTTTQVTEDVKVEETITPEVEQVSEEVPAKEITAEPKYYTVQKGETLWGLSEKNLGAGKRWGEIQDMEGQTFTEETAKTLQAGQQILIPNK